MFSVEEANSLYNVQLEMECYQAIELINFNTKQGGTNFCLSFRNSKRKLAFSVIEGFPREVCT